MHSSVSNLFALAPEELVLQPVRLNLVPDEHYAESQRKWQGIPGIECTKSRRLWAAWYSGGRTEDENNHIVLVTSVDGGKKWSDPVMVIDPPGHVRAADPVLWLDPQGRLWLFWMQTGTYNRQVFDGRAGVWAIFSENPCEENPTWSTPKRIANGVMMNKPTVLKDGSWLLPIAIWLNNQQVRPRKHHIAAEAFSKVYISRDEGKTFTFHGKADVPKRTCDEHMILEKLDGSLWMLVRRVDGIGRAISHDGGMTWSADEEVFMPGPNSRFHIRRLKSGRLLLLYHGSGNSIRSHLTAYLSEDDGETWPYNVLLDEREDVSYPDVVEDDSGCIFVIYDRHRVGEGEILLQKWTETEMLEGTRSGHQAGRLIMISALHRPNIGTRIESFASPFLLDQMENVCLRQHFPQRKEIALTTDRPWEGNMCGYVTVLRDADKLRMYYKAGHSQEGTATKENRFSHPLWVCYAESTDGIHWERPELGLFEFDGSFKNNIVFTGIGPDSKGVHGFSPFIDSNPHCPPEERYKAIGSIGTNPLLGDLYAFCSPDGLNWRLLQEEPILRQRVHGAFDSQNTAFWDAERAEYRIYFRDYLNRDATPGDDELVKTRSIKTAKSNDFFHWTDFQFIHYPGVEKEQLYTNQIQLCPEAPHLLVGFPTRYIQRPWSEAIEALPENAHRKWRREIFFDRFGAALTDGLFLTSRNGTAFTRWPETFLEPASTPRGNWFYGDNYQCLGLWETTDPDESFFWSFVATENTGRSPGTKLRRFTVRKHGFVSVHSPQEGMLSLQPFYFSGSNLHLNFSTSAAGSVRVQLETWSGDAIEGFTMEDCEELIGSAVDRQVRWKNQTDLTKLHSQLIRVRFNLKEAHLFSIQFR